MQATMVAKQEKGFTLMNKLGVLVVAVLLSFSCKDTVNSTDFFTPVQVYININLDLPTYVALSLPQGYVYEAAGNRGVIVYRTIFNEYVAFDRTCPHNPTDACSYVSMDSTSAYYACGQYNPGWKGCCNSKFDPATGNPLSGPARRALKQYYVKQDGRNLLITNTPM